MHLNKSSGGHFSSECVCVCVCVCVGGGGGGGGVTDAWVCNQGSVNSQIV